MNNTIPAVDKTVQILEMLAGSPCSQGELSRALGISMSTAYRILQTLRAREWVAKDDAGRYALASGLLPLLKGFDADLEILKRARAKVEETKVFIKRLMLPWLILLQSAVWMLYLHQATEASYMATVPMPI